MASIDVDDVRQERQARASLYALLASFFLRPHELGLQCITGPMPAAQPKDAAAPAAPDDALSRAWQQLLLALRSPEARQSMLDEHAAIFEAAGTPAINPYASAYLEGPLMSGPLGRVRQDLARLGLQRAEHAPEPEDHLGALCEAMQQLVLRDAPAPEQLRFLRRHLSSWADPCLDDIAAQPTAHVYRAVAAFAGAFLAADEAALNEDCESAALMV